MSELHRALEYFADLGFEDLRLSESVLSSPSPAQPKAAEVPRVAKRTSAAPDQSPPPASHAAVAPVGDRAERLRELEAQALACTRCPLAEGRTKVVFGSGAADADLMFIGEGPGANEDREGLPFVGAAGELLTKIIEAIDLKREAVYIANIVKCRPPNNRDPMPHEVEACRDFIAGQITNVAPRAIIALGRVAAQTLLGVDSSIARMRGKWWTAHGVPVRVTYHPAALLRNASYKRPTWEDVQVVRDYVLESASARE